MASIFLCLVHSLELRSFKFVEPLPHPPSPKGPGYAYDVCYNMCQEMRSDDGRHDYRALP